MPLLSIDAAGCDAEASRQRRVVIVAHATRPVAAWSPDTVVRRCVGNRLMHNAYLLLGAAATRGSVRRAADRLCGPGAASGGGVDGRIVI